MNSVENILTKREITLLLSHFFKLLLSADVSKCNCMWEKVKEEIKSFYTALLSVKCIIYKG